MKRKIGLSTFGLQDRYGDRRAIEIAKEAGADAIDFSLHKGDCTNPCSIYSRSEDEIVSYYIDLKRHADSLGIEICQTHGRLKGYRPDEEWNKNMRENARLDCIATKALGSPVTVVHSVPLTPPFPVDVDPALMHDLNFRMFSEMLEDAKKYGVKIASETFGDSPRYGVCDFFGTIDHFTSSFERVRSVGNNADYFFTCVDTGHSNKAMRFGNPTPADVIRRLGSSIVCLHLNDNDTFTDQHKPPLTGTIDWDDVFDALDEVGYSGVYNMEISLQRFGEEIMEDTAAYSVKILKNILDKRYG
jgi:sugar phosphate isomerase/epimerase